jgi:MFS family permease
LLVAARVVIGLASAAAPVYISEVAPPESRGRLVSFFQLAVTIGILAAYLVGLAFDHVEGWRWMLGLGCVPALTLAFGMVRMPQSPRWLVMSGDDFAARATLAKIRATIPTRSIASSRR